MLPLWLLYRLELFLYAISLPEVSSSHIWSWKSTFWTASDSSSWGYLELPQYYWRVQFLSNLTSLLPLLKSVFSKLFCLPADFCWPCCPLTFSFLCLKGVGFCATLLTGYQFPVKDCGRKVLFWFHTRFLLPSAFICYPKVIIFGGLHTKRTGCNSWKMHLQETKPKHCHRFSVTEISYNHSKKRARKVILFISSFEACSTVAEVLLTDIPPAELNIFYHCFKHVSCYQIPHHKHHAIS